MKPDYEALSDKLLEEIKELEAKNKRLKERLRDNYNFITKPDYQPKFTLNEIEGEIGTDAAGK